MKIKLVTMRFVVLVAIFISAASMIWGQKGSNPDKTMESVIRTKFHDVVGRDPTPDELTNWKNVGRNNEIKGLNVPIGSQIMDWFVAPAQAGERTAMIEKAYNFWFKRAATQDEQAKCEKLVKSNRIAYGAMIDTISADLAITRIEDIAGDPRSINVTIENLGPISTSRKTGVGLEFAKGNKCIRDLFAPEPALFDVPPIAPKKSTVIKVTSTNVLQRSITTRAYYVIVSSDWNYEPSATRANNTSCIPGIAIGKDNVINQKPDLQFPKNLPKKP